MPNQRRQHEPESSDSWQACPPGQLQQVGQRLRTARRRRKLARAAQVGAWSLLLVAVGVFLGSLAISGDDVRNPGGISCLTCVARFETFHATVTNDEVADPLPEEQLAQVRAHLDGCNMCRSKFEARYPGVLEGLALLGPIGAPIALLSAVR